jgi:hypothetical protein
MESQMHVDVEVTAATDNHVHECNVLECHEPAVGECNEVDSTEKCNSRNYCSLHIAHISHDFQLLKEVNFPFAMLIEYYYDFMLTDINYSSPLQEILLILLQLIPVMDLRVADQLAAAMTVALHRFR